jgi:cytochrome c oxidase subunit 2
MKKDAIPGFVNELWFRADTVGTYRGQCAELCGRDHGFMPIVVKVVQQPEYDQWLKDQQGSAGQGVAAPAVANVPSTTPAANASTIAQAE